MAKQEVVDQRGQGVTLRELPHMRGRLVKIIDWEYRADYACYCAQELARQCNVSLRHLQRHFKNQYELKLQSWLNELRLYSAYRRLLDGQSVKEVCYSLGYKQVSHFSREFKRYHGINPSMVQSHELMLKQAVQEKAGAEKEGGKQQLHLF